MNTNRLLSVVLFLLLGLPALSRAAEASTPVELAKLKQTYQTELARVADPVKKRYAEALVRLRETYTKAGQLDKALAVKTELELLMQEKNEAKTKIADKDLDESKWTWGSGGTLTLHRQNKAMHSAWGEPGIWKRVGEFTIEIIKSDGTKMTVVFPDGELAVGEVISQVGAKTTITRLPK